MLPLSFWCCCCFFLSCQLKHNHYSQHAWSHANMKRNFYLNFFVVLVCWGQTPSFLLRKSLIMNGSLSSSSSFFFLLFWEFFAQKKVCFYKSHLLLLFSCVIWKYLCQRNWRTINNNCSYTKSRTKAIALSQ